MGVSEKYVPKVSVPNKGKSEKTEAAGAKDKALKIDKKADQTETPAALDAVKADKPEVSPAQTADKPVILPAQKAEIPAASNAVRDEDNEIVFNI